MAFISLLGKFRAIRKRLDARNVQYLKRRVNVQMLNQKCKFINLFSSSLFLNIMARKNSRLLIIYFCSLWCIENKDKEKYRMRDLVYSSQIQPVYVAVSTHLGVFFTLFFKLVKFIEEKNSVGVHVVKTLFPFSFLQNYAAKDLKQTLLFSSRHMK